MVYKKTKKAIKEYILDFYQITPYRLNKVSGLTTTTMQNLASGKTRITLKTAVILETAFPDNGMKAKDWFMLDIDEQFIEFKKDKKNVEMLKRISPTTMKNKGK